MAGDGTIGGPTGTTTGSTSITMPTSLGAELSSAAATCSMEAPISLTAADFMAAPREPTRSAAGRVSPAASMAASPEVFMAVASTAAGSMVVAVAAMVVGVAEAIDSALPLLLASPLL